MLTCFDNCLESLKILKTWRKAQVIAFFKLGKEPTDPKKLQASLTSLSSFDKDLERIIHNCLVEIAEPLLNTQQAGLHLERTVEHKSYI